jgi:hypothetical protein
MTQQKHKLAVATYIDGKVREFSYHLKTIVDSCDRSFAACGENRIDTEGKIVVYGFSSYTNAMQALKDAIKTIGASPLTWTDIAQVAHGDFISKARNAITHDGNPIVNAWVDGKYFVASDISRVGVHGEPIEIVRPNEDVRTVCLQFAAGFASVIRDRLTLILGTFQLGGSPFNMAEFEDIVGSSPLIPEHVKQMTVDNRDAIRAAIENAPPSDPLKKAIVSLDDVIAYCNRKLGNA